MHVTPRQIIAELVALKDLKDEYERCKQRRAVAFKRDLDEVARVETLKADYERRKTLAWGAARAFLAEPEAQPVDARAIERKTAERCREIAMWPQGIDDEQAYYGRMFAEFIEKEFKLKDTP